MLLNPQPQCRTVSTAALALLGVLLAGAVEGAPIAAGTAPTGPQAPTTEMPRRPADPADAANRLAGLLHLDDAQKGRVQDILERERVALDRMWHDSTIPIVERAIASKTQHEHTTASIRAVLNRTQASLFAKLTQSRADTAGETPAAPRPLIKP